MGALTGGCACGAVRYRAGGGVKFAFLCQCRACQQMSGSGHAAQFASDAAGFEVSGDLGWWQRDSASGNTVAKAFCPVCGSPVFGRPSRAEGLVMVLAGSLDDPAQVEPDRIFYTEEALPWDRPALAGAG